MFGQPKGAPKPPEVSSVGLYDLQPQKPNFFTAPIDERGYIDLREKKPVTSDGGSTSYYRLPEGATELNDLIEAKGMGFALGNIFKACYRMGEKDGADVLYDLNKIIFFAERLKGFLAKNGRLP